MDNTIIMYDPSSWIVRNLEICNAGQGIIVRNANLNHEGLHFENLKRYNIDLIVNGQPSGNGYYSTGIRIEGGGAPAPSSTEWLLRDLEVVNIP